MDLNRIVQKQIEQANREKFDRVKTSESVKLAGFGQTDLSSQIAAPTIMWRREEYEFLLPLHSSVDDAIFALDGKVSVSKNITVVNGGLGGGFTTFLRTYARGVLNNHPGLTQIYSTKIMSLSERNITVPLDVEVTTSANRETGEGIVSIPKIGMFIKSDNADGKYPQWTSIFHSSIDPGSGQASFGFGLEPGDWATIALFVYGGFPYNINVREAFKDLSLSLDSWSVAANLPPSAPTWAAVPLSTDYLDDTIGNSKNILEFNTPTDEDWLGVGIYRTSTSVSSDFNLSPVSGNDVLRSTAINRTDLGRDFKWSVYGPSSATTQAYSFVREQEYNANLIPDGTFLYDSANWRTTIGGGAGSDTILLNPTAPLFAPNCMKSSADYSGSGTFDMTIQSSVFAVDKEKSYNLEWNVKRTDLTTTLAMNSSYPLSAVQITYYSDAVHTLCVDTAYQLVSKKYNSPEWTQYNQSIHAAPLVDSFNPFGGTGASALPDFVMPNDCTHIDVSFKMMHGASARSVLYFDGANCELASGLPSYHNYQSGATVLTSREALSSQESTAYGVLRLPLLGNEIEIYAGHTSLATGESEYLSSAHWAKFQQGFYAGVEQTNRLKNGMMHTWDSGINSFTYWDVSGNEGQPLRWQATDTAIYGSTSFGLYWGTPTGGGGGVKHQWNSPPIGPVTLGFWLKVDTGAVKIGDLNQSLLGYKQARHWWYTNHKRGTKDNGPPHLTTNEILVDTGWNYHTIHLATSNVMHVFSDLPGTRCYLDGVSVVLNEQDDGTFRNYSAMFDNNLSRYPGQYGTVPKPTSYIKASTNSIDNDVHTIRCWFTPSYDWIQKTTATGTSDMPRATIWYLGEEIGTITDKRWLYYIPFNNADSSGGYFEYYVEHFTGVSFNQELLPARRLEFKAMDPIHLAVTYHGKQNDRLDRGQFTKLYVNGDMVDSSYATDFYNAGAWRSGGWDTMDRPDNLTIGAIPGQETTTAYGYDMFGDDASGHPDTAYGAANGVISEVRVDNYAWSQEQVIQDQAAELPRMDPNGSIENTIYTHLVDKIRDGSEKNTITHEDTGVKIGNDYEYVLDAFDYGGNRSVFSDTASITAGDNTGPQAIYTDTGSSVSKGGHITYRWVNPTDSDFSHTWVKLGHAPYTDLDKFVPGKPGEWTTWSAGFVGYGNVHSILIAPFDKAGNVGSDIPLLARTTKKGPIKGLDGAIYFNKGYGFEDGKDLINKEDTFSWAMSNYAKTSPTSPLYSDLRVFTYDNSNAADDDDPSVIVRPMKMDSAKGLTLDTAYYIYLIDSAAGRTDAVRMQYSLDLSASNSVTAYPLGKFYTGNSSVKGYFTPSDDSPQFNFGSSMRFGRVEDTSGLNYLDLNRGVLHSETVEGDYSELSGSHLTFYDKSTDKTYASPKIIKHIPASLVNAGAVNDFVDWGLGTSLPATPIITLQPVRVQTYYKEATHADQNDQFLELSTDGITLSSALPHVRIYRNSTTVEEHSANATQIVEDAIIGQMPKVLTTYTAWKAYAALTDIRDSASGLDGVAYGLNAISRIDIDMQFTGSTDSIRHSKLIRGGWRVFYDDTDADAYDDDPSDAVYHWQDFTVAEGWINNFTISRTFATNGSWKPMGTYFYSGVKEIGAGAPEWLSYTTAGLYYARDMKVNKITYYDETGTFVEQTGTGIVSALVIV